MAARVKREKRAGVRVTGMELRTRAELSSTVGGRTPIEHRLLDVSADRTIEVRFELPAEWDGRFPLDPEALTGARVKPVVLVPEELASEVDRHALRAEILDAGAAYCKVPAVQVARRRVKRDARHETALPLEESLRIFAEETKPERAEEVLRFAAALARAADAGEEE
jgi:hypothetical protein